MRPIDQTLAARLARAGAGTARALRLFPKSGGTLGLTDHDQPLKLLGTVFRSAPGMRLGPLTRRADLAPDHAEIETALGEGGLEQGKLAAGELAGVRADLWLVDTEDPSFRLMLSKGTIGEAAIEGDRVLLEYRGMKEALGRPVGRVYQKSCDAVLYDRRCGLDAADHSHGVTILQADGLSLQIESADGTDPSAFAGGSLRFDHHGLPVTAPIRTARRAARVLYVTLWEAFPAKPENGTAATITLGCDKRFSTCRDRLGNAENFRGFPSIPGTDTLAVKAGRR